MIRFEVRWQNFRGFADTGWIRIRPITLFVGSNNTGKSTLIAPLLLLKQTLRSRAADVPLVTRGDLSNVGGFRDFVYRHEVDRDVIFDIRWHSHKPEGDEDAVGRFAPGQMRLSFGFVDDAIVLSGVRVYDLYRRLYMSRMRRATGSYSVGGLPNQQRAGASARAQQSDRAVRMERPRHFLFEGNGVFEAQIPDHLDTNHDEDGDEPTVHTPRIDISDWAREYWSVATFSSTKMSQLLRETSYLGPLREPLRRVYELAGDPPRDVGTRGESAPEILFRQKELLAETRTWLRHFGLGRSLRTQANREDAFSLYFPAGGGRPSVNLADVGFGASQILPMIVQGLAAQEDDLLAMEQPEIHLNPRLQSRIADFFAFMAESGKGVLVETHSEHLLLRLRTLMAKGEVAEEDVALYFVDRDRGSSHVQPIPIADDGYIDPRDWPKGFFHESVREAVALATEQDKRHRAAG